MLENKIEIHKGDTTQTLCSGLEQELLDDNSLRSFRSESGTIPWRSIDEKSVERGSQRK